MKNKGKNVISDRKRRKEVGKRVLFLLFLIQERHTVTGLLNKRLDLAHRNQKSLNRLLKVCYVPATSTDLIAFFSSFFCCGH